ncbi:MAG TPA: hypothetical protein VIG99_22535 [Myxococcaceae bacterium]
MKRAAVGLVLGALVLLACGPPSVKGSLSVLMDMRYQTIDIVMLGSDVTVRYVKPSNENGQGEDLVLAVSTRGLRLPFAADAGVPLTFDLAEDIGAGQRGALARNVANDLNKTFPLIERGQMTFNNVPVLGQQTSGDFAVTFVLGEEFGDGRTLYDNFQGKVR